MANKADTPVESSPGTRDVNPNEDRGSSASTDKTAVGEDSPSKSRKGKYNQLLRVEEELGDGSAYPGKNGTPTK